MTEGWKNGMAEKRFAGFALPCFFLSQRRKGAKGNDGGGMTEKRNNGKTEKRNDGKTE